MKTRYDIFETRFDLHTNEKNEPEHIFVMNKHDNGFMYYAIGHFTNIKLKTKIPMNETPLFDLLLVSEIRELHKDNVRNCKIRDLTIEECGRLWQYLQVNYSEHYPDTRNDSTNCILELLYRYDHRLMTIKK